jgi:hypothetical protein
MNILSGLKEFFKYNHNQVIKHFLGEELNDINKEIILHQGYIRELEVKRNKVELMVFGN